MDLDKKLEKEVLFVIDTEEKQARKDKAQRKIMKEAEKRMHKLTLEKLSGKMGEC